MGRIPPNSSKSPLSYGVRVNIVGKENGFGLGCPLSVSYIIICAPLGIKVTGMVTNCKPKMLMVPKSTTSESRTRGTYTSVNSLTPSGITNGTVSFVLNSLMSSNLPLVICARVAKDKTSKMVRSVKNFFMR